LTVRPAHTDVEQPRERLTRVAPGVVVTARNGPVPSHPAYAERVTAHIPMHAFGQPEDMAGAVLLLCSQAGRYITGANIPVDGGMHL